MLQREGSAMRVCAAMAIANAGQLLRQGQELLVKEADITRVDLSAVTEADSSALTVLFAWLRRAQAQGRRLTIVAPPASLLSLAELYGVTDLLPLAE